MGQPGMEASAGDRGQLGGGNFLDERMPQAVEDLGPFVVLDGEAGFHEAARP